MVQLLGSRSDVAPSADSIFYDPDFDGPPAAPAPRVQVVSTGRREWFTRQRITGLGEVDLLVGIDRAQETSAAGGADGREWEDRRPAPGEDPVADGPGDVLDFLIVALRVEMAAVYLRLVGNALQ